MKENQSGFDPEKILKSASSNVISGFCLNEFYDFGDSEQMQILKWSEIYLKNFLNFYLIGGMARLCPDFIIRRGLSRKILTTFKAGFLSLEKWSQAI